MNEVPLRMRVWDADSLDFTGWRAGDWWEWLYDKEDDRWGAAVVCPNVSLFTQVEGVPDVLHRTWLKNVLWDQSPGSEVWLPESITWHPCSYPGCTYHLLLGGDVLYYTTEAPNGAEE